MSSRGQGARDERGRDRLSRAGGGASPRGAPTQVFLRVARRGAPPADGQPVPVIDRGGAIKGHKLDVFFDSHEAALEWGRQWVAVAVVDCVVGNSCLFSA